MSNNSVTKERSWMMARVKSRNTKPELVVRKIVYGLGFRYRLCVNGLPGKPDLAFIGRKKAIYVHGCFWHRHDCPRGTMPATRRNFWKKKLDGNRLRDAKIMEEMKRLGWSVLIVWECQLKDRDEVARIIRRFLNDESVETELT